MYKNIAVVQAAAGDLAAAQRTVTRISPVLQNGAYAEVVTVLLEKGDLVAATQITADFKDEWRAFTDVFRNEGAAYGKSDDIGRGLAWARQQQNDYAKADALLGVAQGMLEQNGIENMFRREPSMPMAGRCPLL